MSFSSLHHIINVPTATVTWSCNRLLCQKPPQPSPCSNFERTWTSLGRTRFPTSIPSGSNDEIYINNLRWRVILESRARTVSDHLIIETCETVSWSPWDIWALNVLYNVSIHSSCTYIIEYWSHHKNCLYRRSTPLAKDFYATVWVGLGHFISLQTFPASIRKSDFSFLSLGLYVYYTPRNRAAQHPNHQ